MTVRYLPPLPPNTPATTALWPDEFSPISTKPLAGMTAPMGEVVWQDLTLLEMSTRCHPRGNVALEPVVYGWVSLAPCGACL